MSTSIRVALNSLITQPKACISISGRVSAKKRDQEGQRERDKIVVSQKSAKNKPVKENPDHFK